MGEDFKVYVVSDLAEMYAFVSFEIGGHSSPVGLCAL
jgi:hypothetical protein